MLFVRAIDNEKWFPDIAIAIGKQHFYPVFAAQG
jgi:hypothetical protein